MHALGIGFREFRGLGFRDLGLGIEELDSKGLVVRGFGFVTTLVQLFMLAAGGFHSVAVLGWGFWAFYVPSRAPLSDVSREI